MASEFHPELAIVDIRMPDLDGFELMAQLKARFPGIDVILMTGSVDDLDDKLVRAIRSAAFYFIQKPFDREVLRTLVERCRRAALATRGPSAEPEAAGNGDGRSTGVPAEPAARSRSHREWRRRLLPLHAMFRAGRRPVRLRSRECRTDRADRRRRVRPRRIGSDAHGDREERVSGITCRWLRARCRRRARVDRTRPFQPGPIRDAGRSSDLVRTNTSCGM